MAPEKRVRLRFLKKSTWTGKKQKRKARKRYKKF